MAVANEIALELKEVGINIILEEVSDKQYQNYLKNHKYEMLLTGVYSSISPNLNGFLGDNDLANYKNEEINTILKELNNISSEELLKEKYKKILEILNENIPYIGLYRNQDVIIYQNNFRGNITPNNYSIYYNIDEWYTQSEN